MIYPLTVGSIFDCLVPGIREIFKENNCELGMSDFVPVCFKKGFDGNCVEFSIAEVVKFAKSDDYTGLTQYIEGIAKEVME